MKSLCFADLISFGNVALSFNFFWCVLNVNAGKSSYARESELVETEVISACYLHAVPEVLTYRLWLFLHLSSKPRWQEASHLNSPRRLC